MSPKSAILEPAEMPSIEPPAEPMTIERFLAYTETRPDDEKWELIEGKAVMQASASKPHQIIAANIGGLLWSHMQATQASWTPLQGVGTKVPASPNSLPQPDVMVLEHPLADDDFSNITDDALVLFEIISRSNSKRDQAWRRRVYASIPNCRHYVTVHQRRVEIVRYDRAADWAGTMFTAIDTTLDLPALGASLPLVQIYARTPVGAKHAGR